MTQLPIQMTQELSYSRTQPTQVLHNSLARQAKGLCQDDWHVSYHQFPILFLPSLPKKAHIRLRKKPTKTKANVFSAIGIAFVWNAFKASRSSSQQFSCIYAYFLSSHWPLPTLLNAPPLLKPYKKLLFFFHNYSLRPIPLLRASEAKPTLGVCLLKKIASFIYRSLALFSQWIPGLNVISQETLPMCTPVIPHRLQTESSASKRKKKKK